MTSILVTDHLDRSRKTSLKGVFNLLPSKKAQDTLEPAEFAVRQGEPK